MKLIKRCSLLFFVMIAGSHAALTNDYQKTVSLLESQGIKFDSASAQKAAISAYVKEIDPHAQFLSNEESRLLLASKTGKFYYLGCSLTFSNGVPEVSEVKESGPAKTAGLQVGNILRSIDGKDLAGLRFAEVLDRLRFLESREVVFRVLQGEEEKDLLLTPRSISTESIQRAEILPFNIGYLKLNGLYSGSTEAVSTLINKWVKDGLIGLVLDLRNANGDDVEAIPKIADSFCPPKKELFRVVEIQSKKVRIFRDLGNLPEKLPLICLINKYSSGASEVLASCLKEVGSSTMLVGENSSGDMSLRSLVSLDKKSQFYLATKSITVNQNREFTGRQSVQPDILVKDININGEVISVRSKEAAEKNKIAKDAILLKNRLSHDACLQRAADILLGLQALNIKNS